MSKTAIQAPNDFCGEASDEQLRFRAMWLDAEIEKLELSLAAMRSFRADVVDEIRKRV